MSPADQDLLDRHLAAVLAEPEDRQRFQTFYDPQRPTWMVRSDPFLIHFAYDVERDEVTFLNLFRRR